MSAETQTVAAALPGYEIGGELGRGGFGVVLSGKHRQLGRLVAIKELPQALATDPDVRARFAAEARVLAGFDHPHIVPVYDYVEQDGVCLLVMEHLPGGTVWEMFNEKGMTPNTACAIVLVACEGLHYAHQRGVLHRDVKPENMLFSATGTLKVTDFGIAKVVGGGDVLATRVGDIMGTPAYMAPEQAEGKELGPQADVYATGIMLYELLSGKLPFSEEGGPLAIIYRHVYEDPIPVTDVAPQVPEPVADVVMRALARDPNDRFASAEEFGVALGEASARVWRQGWLQGAGVSLVTSGAILAAVNRATVPHPPPTHEPPETDPVAAPPDDRGTVVVGGPPPPARGNETVRPGEAVRPPIEVVRPSVSVHVAGGQPDDIAAGEFVPVRQVLDPPGRPVGQLAATVALLAAAVIVAFMGIGEPERVGALAPGQAFVAGADVTAAGPIELDLDQSIGVVVRDLPPAAAGADRARLGFNALGVPLIDSSARALESGPEGAVTSVEANANRFIAAGTFTAALELLQGDEVLARHEFAVRSTQPAYLTLTGIGTILLVLVVLAYTESLLRPMWRRGRLRPTGVLGLGVMGAGLGVIAVLGAWVLGTSEPMAPTFLVAAILGAAAGVAGALSATRAGRRAKVRRAMKRDPGLQAAGGRQ